MKSKKVAAVATTPLPSSWDLETWDNVAPHVWPGTEKRARELLRHHKVQLWDEGALTRIGRRLVFIGVGYQRWLESNARLVWDFDVPANRAENSPKRFGGRSKAKATSAS